MFTLNADPDLVELFGKLGKVCFIDAQSHDMIMAKTHLQVVLISEQIKLIADRAKDVPDELLPTSFKRLKAMAEQFLDMPPGTKESILANKY